VKLTKEHLKTIIQEELQAVLEEARGNEKELQEGYFDFSKLADKIAGDLDGLEAELNKRIDNLGSLVRQNSAALDRISQGEPAAMRPGLNEEGDWPEKVKKGRFTKWCKRNGFEDGAGIGCAEKAMDSDDASVRGMASFYMNTVKPKGKTTSDL
jgi:hypothetical protein